MREEMGSHPGLTAGVKQKRPHCIWNLCADCKTGQIWEQISQSFVRIHLRLLCPQACVCPCFYICTSEWEREKRKERDSGQWLQFPASTSFCTSSESGGREKRGKNINKIKNTKPEWNHITYGISKPWVSGIICSDNGPAYTVFTKAKHKSSISFSIWSFISSSQLHIKNKGTGINFRCVPLWFMLSCSMPATLMAFYHRLHTCHAHPTLAWLERNEEELRG